MALLIAGIGYTQLPAQKSEAAITSQGYFNFSYNTTTGLGTWNWRMTINDTFTQNYQFQVIGPAGSIVTAATAPLTCAGLPSAPTVNCTLTFPPGGTTVEITITSPYTRLCTAQNVAIGGVVFDNPGINNNTALAAVVVVPASLTSSVGGSQVPNTVPANAALCPVQTTPVPTATPTSTPLPAPVVVPQVVQNPARGGIFNGSRNDTPTPVRPREVGTAGSTGVGLPPANAAGVTLRPPSTGDAGLLMQKLRIGAW